MEVNLSSAHGLGILSEGAGWTTKMVLLGALGLPLTIGMMGRFVEMQSKSGLHLIMSASRSMWFQQQFGARSLDGSCDD